MIPENEWTKSQREFVGTQFHTDKGSVLTVTGVAGKSGSSAVFSLDCSVCSKDVELFPAGSITSIKDNLEKGKIPCGCAKTPRWTPEQDLILTNRLLSEKIPYLKAVDTIEEKGKDRKFILECDICSKDSELWPYGRITSRKSHLVSGGVPCGCAKNPRWSPEQYGIRIHRECTDRGYEFLGFVGDWKRQKTPLRLHNPSNGNTWESTTIDNFFSNGNGCPLEARNKRWTVHEREQQINKVFAAEGGVFVGWSEDYKNHRSKFKWFCSEGHSCETSVSHFLNKSNRCMTCRKIKQREEGVVYGYYPKRTEEQDYLYIIHFVKDDYIKVGRSFDVEQRLKGTAGLLKLSGHERNEVEILRVYTGSHKDVYDTEQRIHEELTERGFYHEESEWTVETFDPDCKDVLFRLLRESSLSVCSRSDTR